MNFLSQPLASYKLPHVNAFYFGSCHPQISQPRLQETWHTQVWIWETGFAGECVTCVLAAAIPEQVLVVYMCMIVSAGLLSSSTLIFL